MMTSDLYTVGREAFEHAGSKYSYLTGPEQVERDYSHGLPVARNKFTNEVVRIPYNETTKVLLMGNTGSGKTIAAKRITIIAYLKRKMPVLNGADTKNDFQSLDYKNGIKQELVRKMGLLKGEKPQPVPKKLFMPKILVDRAYDHTPSYVEPYTLGFQDISHTDFKFLIGRNRSEAQEAVLSDLLYSIDINNAEWSMLYDHLSQMMEDPNSDHQKAAVRTVRRRLNRLDRLNVLSENDRPDKHPVQYLKDGFNVSLGFDKWEEFESEGTSDKNILEFYAANMLRQLRYMLPCKELPNGASILLPEVHEFAPAGKNSLLKEELYRFITKHARQAGTPIVMDTQDPSQIPNSDHKNSKYDFLDKMNHVFIMCDNHGNTLGYNSWSKVLKGFSFYNPHKPKMWRKKIDMLEPYDALYINSSHSGPKDAPIVRFLAPPCAHTK